LDKENSLRMSLYRTFLRRGWCDEFGKVDKIYKNLKIIIQINMSQGIEEIKHFPKPDLT